MLVDIAARGRSAISSSGGRGPTLLALITGAAIFGGTIVFSVKTSAFMIFLLLCTIVVERWESERRQALARRVSKSQAPTGRREMSITVSPQALV